MHEFNKFPPSNFPVTHIIQNQQTIIPQSNPSIHPSGTFGVGHHSGANVFPTVPTHFGQVPNKNIIINQNQNINDNFLKSEHLENEIEDSDLFARIGDYNPSQKNDMVSSFVSIIIIIIINNFNKFSK